MGLSISNYCNKDLYSTEVTSKRSSGKKTFQVHQHKMLSMQRILNLKKDQGHSLSFDTLSRSQKSTSSNTKGHRKITVRHLSFIFGTTKQDQAPGLIGISCVLVFGNQTSTSMELGSPQHRVGQQYTVMLMKDYEETIETSLDLENYLNGAGDESSILDVSGPSHQGEEGEMPGNMGPDLITEITFTHNGKYITNVEMSTLHGQHFTEPQTSHNFSLLPAQNLYRKTFISQTGIIGFRGSINLQTGFIDKIEIVENHKSKKSNLRSTLPHGRNTEHHQKTRKGRTNKTQDSNFPNANYNLSCEQLLL